MRLSNRVLFSVGASLIVASLASATETTYLGLYMQGQKIGYSTFSNRSEKLNGAIVERSDSTTLMDAALLGTPLKLRIDSTSWTSKSGKPLRVKMSMSSGGRIQTMDAVFGDKNVSLKIVNAGQATTRNLALPNGPVVDDPMALVTRGVTKQLTFYILDPTTASFVKNELKVVGPVTVTVNGKAVSATKVLIIDPRAPTTAYLSAKGDLVKAEGPMGIEIRPEPKAVATKAAPKVAAGADLAFSTALTTDKPIQDPESLIRLKLRIKGPDLSRLPSDAHQTITPDGNNWLVEVHPVSFDRTTLAASVAASQAPDKAEWLKPGLHIPSGSQRFVDLAKQIKGDRKTVAEIADAIQSWVNRKMQPNAGIGVLRDANDVLDTKEGVCRDYAILTATLLRSAGVPARLASGLVNWSGSFYYHAWAEAWDGTNWVGVDSTITHPLTATHIKLAHGTVEEAFLFTFLGKARIEVLDSARKQ